MRILGIFFFFLLTIGCTSNRLPLPPGEIPTQSSVPISEEQYGQQVFRQLSNKFQLDRDDARINRTRAIVEKLTTVKGNDKNIWHVHVFKEDSVHNAAATRGNYIFVWSGLLDSVPDDAELSAILAHEIGHVLAGHTKPDPSQEANAMLADIAQSTTRRILVQSGSGTVAALAGLGGMLVSELIKVIAINPDKQAKELEADQLGLFIMAEAGYDPRKAISFWTRVQHDPNFQNAPIQFLSTHPSSTVRLEQLKQLLPEAMRRYNHPLNEEESSYWIAAEDQIPVFPHPNKRETPLGKITKGESVEVQYRLRRWLFLQKPYEGYVESTHFSPKD